MHDLTLHGNYDPMLVALACVIAVFASFASLNLAGRIRSSAGPAKLVWISSAALALGGGIWSMHFVAMLAFALPNPISISYDIWWTIASMALAIAATAAGYALIAFGSLKPARLILAGLVTGIGVVVMHYSGMAAMLMRATISYDRALFMASIAIAVTAATVALWLSFRLEGMLMKLGASVVMGAAIAGMHFTGMAAASFELCLTADPTAAGGIPTTLLAISIAGATFTILSLGLASALFDQRLVRQATASAEKLTRSERRFRALVSASTDIIAVLDADGRIIYDSPAVKQVLGYSREALIGRPLTELVAGEDDISATRTLIELLLESREPRVTGEIRCRSQSGSIIDLEFVGMNRLDDPDVAGLIINLRDITERNRVAAELRAAKARAESANESKSKFLANISHELRTPLNSIIGFSDILKMAPNGPLGHPQYQGYVEDINRSGNYLLTVINSLLDYTRAESGHLRLENILVDPMAEAKVCLRMFEEQVAAKMINFRIAPVTEDFMLMLDRGKLRQILLNLISNAVKFTPDHGRIALAAQLTENRECLITVEDNGIGMNEADIVSALQPFGQGSQHLQRGLNGAGLGLPMAKALVDLHGGRLEIISARHAGTTVKITLPADRVKQVPQADRPENQPATAPTIRLISNA